MWQVNCPAEHERIYFIDKSIHSPNKKPCQIRCVLNGEFGAVCTRKANCLPCTAFLGSFSHIAWKQHLKHGQSVLFGKLKCVVDIDELACGTEYFSNFSKTSIFRMKTWSNSGGASSCIELFEPKIPDILSVSFSLNFSFGNQLSECALNRAYAKRRT